MKVAIAIGSTVISVALAGMIVYIAALGFGLSGKVDAHYMFQVGWILLPIIVGIISVWVAALKPSSGPIWKILSFGPAIVLLYFAAIYINRNFIPHQCGFTLNGVFHEVNCQRY